RVFELAGDGKSLIAGDASRLSKSFRFDHNWRESRRPEETDPAFRGWIPPGEKDVLRERIDGLPRTPGRPDFLRPGKDSPLATAGAGREDPSLPAYVGAVPPEGVAPWDWQRTWQVPPPGVLLTVSKKPEDGGTYRTINEALTKVKPWATIRILDDATYA